MQDKWLISVVGPTAVGKTTLAIQLAQHFDTEIISADSRQFYQELTIGTAKPSVDELSAIPHHFINHLSVQQQYSAGDFEKDALSKLDELFTKTNIVVMVGGSGLFVRAVTEGLDNLPKAPLEIRNRLNQEYEQSGIKPLQDRLKAIDPEYYETIDRQNPQRVIRALEVYLATGKSISFYQQNDLHKRPFQLLTIGLNMSREKLYERINLRVDQMMKQGLLDEVKGLRQYQHHPALLTVGYVEIFDFLDGKIDLPTAIDQIKQNSRRYAKRQITWFKKYGNTHWFEPQQAKEVIDFIVEKTQTG